ncbi:MAG: LuxR C-terminal-related transcriptional regulator [Nocardioides alkalitolerans]
MTEAPPAPRPHLAADAATDAADTAAADAPAELLVLSNRPFIASTFAEQAAARGLTSTRIVLGESPIEPALVAASTWVVVDVCGDPAAAVRWCRALPPSTTHLVLLITCERSVSKSALAQLLKCRPSGVLGAGLAPEELVSALEMIQCGHMIVQLDRAGETGRFLQSLLLRGAQTAAVPSLSADERELLAMVAQGLSDLEIARSSYVSEATVRRRVSALRKRTDTTRRVELAAWAGAHGYYELPGQSTQPSRS